MNLTEEIFSRLQQITGETGEAKRDLLRTLSAGANGALAAGLRPDAGQGESRAALVAAGTMYALAAWVELDADREPEQFTVGDVTVRNGSRAEAAVSLRRQADRILEPLRADSFAFRGV